MDHRKAFLVAIALLAGCNAGPAPPDDGDGGFGDVDAVGEIDLPEGVDPEGTSLNGTSLNGTSLNGTSLNGTSLNGTSLNGTSLNGTSLNGISLTNVALTASDFSGKRPDGTAVSGAGFVGSLWTGTLSNGAALKLRIDSRAALAAPNADTYAYGVSYETSSGWLPLCGKNAAGAAIAAIPMAGTWNYGAGVTGGGSYAPSTTSFTFACRATAIAKCVELGYKPWKTIPNTTTSLQNHMVACTRMLRADYCGNGSSYTVNGTQINLYDNVGVQGDTQAWKFEADWTAAGARYISSGADQRFRLTRGTPPTCFSSKVSATAGAPSNFSSGTLLMNEYLN